jgi:sulfate adenylyltransferase subunit 1
MDNELLRFTTAGSVDDGKSTLIGRLLFDSKNIFDDQLASVKKISELKGYDYTDLALLMDGLRSEREQGITIDVAYRFFSTPKRKFIIADTPGHIQYTRNMVTGASTANLALVLIDARKGMLEQTCRHAFIASLLQVPHMIVCVNKMDLVSYDESVYNKIVSDFTAFSSKLDIKDIQFVPLSALKGDNVVNRSENMKWYEGPTLMYQLEHVHISSDINHIDCRFPVQYVIRPQQDKHHDYRGYAGRIASGIFKPGDKVMILPSEKTTSISSINTYEGNVAEAFAPMSVTILLKDNIDISRGDMLVRENNAPQVGKEVDVMLCWFNESPMRADVKYILRHTTREVRCSIKEILYKMDINTLHRNESDKVFNVNDIGRVRIRSGQPLFYDSYRRNKITGSLLLIDESTNETVAAGMII